MKLICFVFFYSLATLALSESELDKRLISNTNRLFHFAKSLEHRPGTTSSDLMNARRFKFSQAPDPSPMMFEMNHRNASKSIKNGKKFQVLSYNVALLHAQILGFITILKSPFLEERRSKLPYLIFSQNSDVVMLQELWHRSVPFFTKVAGEFGYLTFVGKNRPYDDGLAIFVKQELLEGSVEHRFTWHAFAEQDPKEGFPGIRVERGYLHLTLTTSQFGVLHLYNTHLQSFRKFWRKRNFQARELGLDIRQKVGKNELAFVAGDLNTSPYFRDEYWIKPDKSSSKSWWKNAIAYSALLHYGDLDDAVVMGSPKNKADIDVTAANAYEYHLTHCNDLAASFTATDCNSLSQYQYSGKEPPSRQDHILLKDLAGRSKITNREILFTQKIDFGVGILIEPSDHYGVLVEAIIDSPLL